jgi:Ca2+/Na+ antiporter
MDDGTALAAVIPAATDEAIAPEDRHVWIGMMWFVFIALMFFAQHTVCDLYFIPAINVFVDKMRASQNRWVQRWGEEAVAGATICALGCNGPELFSNLISLYTHSDAGIGVVVGSEIFNLLIIVGAAVMATTALPLQLDVAPFTRDVFFYTVSIALLYWALLDKQISYNESLVLLSAAVMYVLTVYFTSDIEKCIGSGEKGPSESDFEAGSPANSLEKDEEKRARTASMHGVEVQVEEILHSRITDGRSHMRRRMSATNFDQDGGIDYAAGSEKKPKISRRGTVGPQFNEMSQSLLGGRTLLYKDLREVVVLGEGVLNLEFCPHVWEHVSLRLKCETSDARDRLLDMIAEHSLGKPWVHGYDASPVSAVQRFKHAVTAKDTPLSEKVLAFPEMLVSVCLTSTLFFVDVKDIRREGRWPLCFMGAMAWLAIFSWAMLETCNQINYHIPSIPISFLGITVCAVGTSFPNAVASVIMARQDQPAAAIANALGSNVQNVFLAMALPWAIYSAQQLHFQAIPQHVAGINEGVIWMVGTLALLLFLVLWPKSCTLQWSHGVLLISTYITYLVVTSLETFGVIKPLA